MTTDKLMTGPCALVLIAGHACLNEVERGEKSAMDENALREIKARANAATPGPWSAQTRLDSFGEYAAGPFHATGDCLRAMCDARFIADAREDVLRLLAEVNRLRSVLARCREVQKAAAERWRDEVAEAAAIVSLVAAERDAARAEVERLRREVGCDY